MSGAPYITIDFYPNAARQARLRPISAKLVVTDPGRQAVLKLGFFSKEIVGNEHIAVVCHDVKAAEGLVKALREAAQELEASIAKASNPFAR